MNQILNWLGGGDLTSDGDATQVADLVIENPFLLDDLMEGLHSEDEVVRGRAADAVEKVSRHQPENVAEHLPQILQFAENDPVPMVRWHLAMVLGHISMIDGIVEEITATLLRLLAEKSVFTQSWAIVSLCIVARQHPATVDRITPAISKLSDSPSKAIQAKVRYAMPLLTNPETAMPKGWVKSIHLQHLNRAGKTTHKP